MWEGWAILGDRVRGERSEWQGREVGSGRSERNGRRGAGNGISLVVDSTVRVENALAVQEIRLVGDGGELVDDGLSANLTKQASVNRSRKSRTEKPHLEWIETRINRLLDRFQSHHPPPPRLHQDDFILLLPLIQEILPPKAKDVKHSLGRRIKHGQVLLPPSLPIVVHLALQKLTQVSHDLPRHARVDKLGPTDERRDVPRRRHSRHRRSVRLEQSSPQQHSNKVIGGGDVEGTQVEDQELGVTSLESSQQCAVEDVEEGPKEG